MRHTYLHKYMYMETIRFYYIHHNQPTPQRERVDGYIHERVRSSHHERLFATKNFPYIFLEVRQLIIQSIQPQSKL